MEVIRGKSFQEVYKKSIMEVLKKGSVVSPRGTSTFEISPATLVIEDARQFLTMPRKRKGNHTFQLAEALWMLRGSDSLEEIAHYNSIWRYFEDKDYPGILNGAYGYRLRAWDDTVDQFVEVRRKLEKDPHSRQAVTVIFDPIRDNLEHSDGSYSKDIPCTNYFAFTIREGKLNMWTVMRSNDLHKGTIYDIPNFMLFQNIIAGWLGVEVGKYTHSANSFHIYESDIENLIEVYNDKEDQDVYQGLEREEINKFFGDPRLGLEEFNETMLSIAFVENATRNIKSIKEFNEKLDDIHGELNHIDNKWWRSVAAQIAMYNLRKLGATENRFKDEFLIYIHNEYRENVKGWKAIKKKR